MKRVFKTKFGVCLLLLAAMLVTLVGCQGQQTGGGKESDEQSGTQEIETAAETEDEVMEMKVLFDGNTNYTIVCGTDEVAKDLAASFLSAVKKKTGLRNINFANAQTQESALEILVGNVGTRSESVAGMAATAYTRASATFIGDKLAVSGYTKDLLEDVLNDLVDALVQNEDGAWCVPSSLSLTADDGMGLTIPSFWNANTTYQGMYVSNGNRYQVALNLESTAENLADYNTYCEKLITEGYTLHASNQIGENRFATYYNAKTELHLMWYPALSSLRIVYAPLGYLPEQSAPNYQKVTEATVSQPAREAVTYAAAGESYVVQLEDGSFVIIDGGPGKAADVTALMDWLTAHKPSADAKPRVTWMFTHLHNDHMELPLSFMERYYDQIDLELVCYNFPNLEKGTGLNDSNCTANYNRLRAALSAYYDETEVLIFHSGQKLYLPGCEIEFLFTQEDYWPNTFPSANHTSSAWRMTFSSGKTFLVLGDCEKGLCAQMATCYGSYLQSDVCQLSHHGVNGATLELYQAIDPMICFWPIDEYRFTNDGRCLGIYAISTDSGYSYTNYTSNPDRTKVWESYRFNYWLRNTEWTRGTETGERLHYHNSKTVTIRMSDLSVAAE